MDKKYYKTYLSYYCVTDKNVQCLFLSPKSGYYSFETKKTLKQFKKDIDDNIEVLTEITEQEYKTELKKLVSKIINQL